jgi:hypothetical protein
VLAAEAVWPGLPAGLDWTALVLFPIGAAASGWHSIRRAAVLFYGVASMLIILPGLRSMHPAFETFLLNTPMAIAMMGAMAVPIAFLATSIGFGSAGWHLHVRRARRRGASSTRASRWPRPRTIVLAFVAVVALGIGWMTFETLGVMNGTPNVAVDYQEHIERNLDAVSTTDRDAGRAAWETLIELMGRMQTILNEANAASMERGRERYFEDDGALDFQYLRDGPTLPEDIGPERDAIEAMRADGAFDDLARYAAGPIGRRVPPPIPGGMLLGANSADAGQARNLARVLVARMRLAGVAGDHGDVADAFDQVMSLAETYSRQPRMVDHLVANGMATLAMRELAQLLMEFQFDEATCRRLLETVDRRRPGSVELALDTERIMFLDVMQRYYTDDGNGDGHGIPSLGAAWLGAAPPGNVLVNFGYSFKSRFVDATRREEIAMFERLTDVVIARSRVPFPEREETSIDLPWDRVRSRYVMTDMLFGGQERFVDHDLYARVFAEGARALLGIETHQRRHGALPADLEALVPDVLASVPVDLYTGEPLIYRPLEGDEHGRPFLLISLGSDGQPDPESDGRPRASYALMDSGKDIVLNPPRDERE